MIVQLFHLIYFRTLDNLSGHVSIGGINTITALLEHPGWVQTHDMVGCMRGIVVDTEELLTRAALAERNVSDHCTEQEEPVACDVRPCQNGGVCMAVYQSYRCECTDMYMGLNCEKGNE